MATKLTLTTRETTLLLVALSVFEKDRFIESEKAEAAGDGAIAERMSGTALELRDLYSKLTTASDIAMSKSSAPVAA